MPRNPQIILEPSDIDRILLRMAHEIIEVNKGARSLAFIGIFTRGVVLARRLGALIDRMENVRIPLGEMDITLYRDDWTRVGTSPRVGSTRIPFSVDRRRVILVDDVLFTGRTTRAAMDALVDVGRPDCIQLAVLVDRGHRELPIQANYVGKYVETRSSENVTVHLQESDGQDIVVIEENRRESS